ncbi:DUF4251 domain-containing protein [Pedobacter sp. AW1-32]|uniref:DUF4251 domain-containing protein n=1 Tax=Pedobacter sp. AW1-32 TaxID=3383026 RepID=UPI003FF0C01D
MKHLKSLFSIALILIAAHTFAQTDVQTTSRIVQDKQYTFVANSAMPLSNNDVSAILNRMPGSTGGSVINLSGQQYDLKVTKDSLVAYLPFYGRSFNAPYNPSEGGIKFTSKDFTYKESKNKKGTYTIQMNTKDLKRENYMLTLTITTTGYATLTASSVNKQAIFFNGYLDEPAKKD